MAPFVHHGGHIAHLPGGIHKNEGAPVSGTGNYNHPAPCLCGCPDPGGPSLSSLQAFRKKRVDAVKTFNGFIH
jgi:hypothetical protein